MTTTFRALHTRNYRLYFTGSAISNVGTWLQRIAQDWLVLHLAGAAALGITTGLQFLPFLFVTPVGGLLADRMPKRRLLQMTQAGMGLSAGLLAFLDLAGVVRAWHVYLIALLFGCFGAMDSPARQAFVVEMVGRDDVPNAVGLNSASFNGARVVGPAIAGFMIVGFGTGWVIFLNAISYLGPIVALGLMRSSELTEQAPITRKKGMLRDGVRYVRGRPDLVLIMAIVAVVGCLGLNFQITSALMATQAFGKGAGQYGVLGTCLALGSLSGALLAARRGRPKQRLIVGSALAFGVVELVAAVMPTYASFAVVLPLLGFSTLTLLTAANTIMQVTVRPEMRGRVMALYMMVLQGGTPIGAPLIGWIGGAFGARWTLVVGGVGSLLGTIVPALVATRSGQLVVRAHVLPRPHVHVWSDARYAARRAILAADPPADAGERIERMLTGGDAEVAAADRLAAPGDRAEPMGSRPPGAEPPARSAPTTAGGAPRPAEPPPPREADPAPISTARRS